MLELATDGLTIALTAAGLVFFLAGTVGLIRFPDTFSRLHALTKADNLGLGFIVLGLALQAESWHVIVKLGLIWALALVAAGTAAQLVARTALRGEEDARTALRGEEDARTALREEDADNALRVEGRE